MKNKKRFDLKDDIDGILVSTVKLRFDDGYETMIFNPDGYDETFNGYKTKWEAKRGHKKAIKYVKKELIGKKRKMKQIIARLKKREKDYGYILDDIIFDLERINESE